jgi:hypothetical protein
VRKQRLIEFNKTIRSRETVNKNFAVIHVFLSEEIQRKKIFPLSFQISGKFVA